MKKILIVNLLLVIILNSFATCFANENTLLKTVKYEKTCETYLKYQGNLKVAHYAYYEENGDKFPAYCLSPELKGVNENMKEYGVAVNEKVASEKIWNVLINGYPYKTIEELGVESKEEAYTATQFAVYTVLHNRDVDDYESIGTDSGNRTLKAYKKIMENAINSAEKITNEVEIITENEKWEIDESEINSLSKTYLVKANAINGAFKVNIKSEDIDELKITDINGKEKETFLMNEKFKIIVPISSLKGEQNLEIEVLSEVESKPIMYGKTTVENTQDYALVGREYEEFIANYEDLLPKNNTSLKIVKQEVNSNKKLEGVKFNLLNASNDSILQNLITDKNGEIYIENMIPGTYFLKEIETLNEYKIIEEPIEINIEFNEEKEIIVENELKPVEVKEVIEEIQKIQKTLPVTGC